MPLLLDPAKALPADAGRATLVGRAWLPAADGPAVVAVRDGRVLDITASAPTVSLLCERTDAAALARKAAGTDIGSFVEILANSAHDGRDPAKPSLLAPIDLQAVKACGVTFVTSLLERVIEEQAKGDPSAADGVRATINREIGGDLAKVKPGSPEAERLKQALIARKLWSQYLEVGIGPYAEVFTKTAPMASVGTGAEIGIHAESTWNNPEPEIVLVVASDGRIVGATLGNDVNLRDFEGRSALLLGKAKDNNGSSAIGPLVRLFDDGFGLDEVRQADITMRVEGPEGFVLDGKSTMRAIARDPVDLVKHAAGPHHQYPDGFVLYTGTLFAPKDDRDAPGMGFTHKPGDVVRIASPGLGELVNRVGFADRIPPWTFGTGALMQSLAKRGLLAG